jgi:predicted ArsR family transcriptional regulator
MPDVTRAIPAARRDLLEALKQRGEAGVETLASELGYSASAVRSLLVALTADGLVEWAAAKQARGRPAHLFRLTDSGERLFPQAYAHVLTSTLEFLKEEEPGAYLRLHGRWLADDRISTAGKMLATATAAEKASALAGLQTSLGIISRAAANADGSASVVIVHCPVYEAARLFPTLFCEAELESIRTHMGGVVERSEHRLNGDAFCVYRIANSGGAEAAGSVQAIS